MKVVYGHTDSIYVQIDDIKTAQTSIKLIEEEVRKSFPNVMGLDEHPVVLEFEKYFSALGVGMTKNRNAGMITWEDGVFLDKEKFTMTGFEAKRVSETKLAKEVQNTVLKMWVNQKSLNDINKYLYETYREVVRGNIPIASIAKKSRLKETRLKVRCPECKRTLLLEDIVKRKQKVCGHKKQIDGEYIMCMGSVSNFTGIEEKYNKTTGKYYYSKPNVTEGMVGVVHAWETSDIEYDDSYVYLKVNEPGKTFFNPFKQEKRILTYASATTFEDLEDRNPDYQHYAELVIKKAEPIYRAMGWDTSSIRNNRIQQTLDEWW
jgi:DNA polymerase elongation subunit (family B)